MKHSKLKKLYRKNKLATNLAIAVIVTAGLGGGVASFIYNAPTKVESTIHSPEHTSAPTTKHVAAEESLAPISNTESTQQPKSTQPSYSPDSIMGEKERMKDPAYRRAHLAPMAVISVKYYGGVSYCVSGGAQSLSMQRVVIMTNSALGGTIKYQVEERQNGAINVLFTGSGFVEDLGGFYETPSLFAYSASNGNADSAIRLHVTSPNDISSPWYSANSCSYP